MTTTKVNPTGIKSFDHRALPGQQERRELLLAMRHWARKLAPEGTDPNDAMSYASWLHNLQNLAASLAFGDATHNCPVWEHDWKYDNPEVYERMLHFPVRVKVEGENLSAMYRCLECKTTWTCGWALDSVLWTG